MTDDQNAHRMPAGEDHSDEEEIIELTDEITPSQEDDDEIIDLTDEITPSQEDDDEIIELTDSQEQGVDQAPPSHLPLGEPESLSDEEEILELSEAIADSPEGSAEPEKPQMAMDAGDRAGDLTGARMDGPEESYDFATVLGLELEPEGGVSPEPGKIADREPAAPFGAESLSVDQLEEIIARVIEKQFTRKIETMLAAVIQKAVAREIRRLKEAFLDERADDL